MAHAPMILKPVVAITRLLKNQLLILILHEQWNHIISGSRSLQFLGLSEPSKQTSAQLSNHNRRSRLDQHNKHPSIRVLSGRRLVVSGVPRPTLPDLPSSKVSRQELDRPPQPPRQAEFRGVSWIPRRNYRGLGGGRGVDVYVDYRICGSVCRATRHLWLGWHVCETTLYSWL